jgi:dihydroorotase
MGPAERERFDTLILGGEVIDPANQRFGRFDIGICEGRIVRVARSLADAIAEQVIDARGQIVTPGLIDLHTHVYWGATYWGIEADPIAARTGVTTWLDVGSAGAYTFPGFRRYVVEPSRVRILALLNLSSIGLVAPTWEFANLDYCDLELAADDHPRRTATSSSASRRASMPIPRAVSGSDRSSWLESSLTSSDFPSWCTSGTAHRRSTR